MIPAAGDGELRWSSAATARWGKQTMEKLRLEEPVMIEALGREMRWWGKPRKYGNGWHRIVSLFAPQTHFSAKRSFSSSLDFVRQRKQRSWLPARTVFIFSFLLHSYATYLGWKRLLLTYVLTYLSLCKISGNGQISRGSLAPFDVALTKE
jgi:hypothetical protein